MATQVSVNGRATQEQVQRVMEMIREHKIEMIDLKFVDLPGVWQHTTVPVSQFDEDSFIDGHGFDGSSIRGFKAIQESDMLLIPDPTTAFIDPVYQTPTLSLICDVVDPVTRQPYNRDARYIGRKAEAFLAASGIADVSYWGPEAEFFVFDNVRFDQNQYSGYYFVNSEEGFWNSGRDGNAPNLGYKVRYKEGYFPVPPTDTLFELRSEMVKELEKIGIPVETHHHEVATAGQCEIDMRFDSLVRMGDNLMAYKYVIKNVARRHGKTVTFMPKPLFGDNGSGMHVHQSLWKDGQNLFFAEDGYAGLSETALYYIGGLLKHGPALAALCSPTTNSYKRLVPGFEAPVNLVYSRSNRSAAVRIPLYSNSPKAKRIEYRAPDASCNPYLAFAAMLMAGIDGIINKIHPGEALDIDIYDLSDAEKARIRQLPGSLGEALDALEADHEFLLRGDVFDKDVLETWIAYKREREVNPIAIRPHPWEFALYFDI